MSNDFASRHAIQLLLQESESMNGDQRFAQAQRAAAQAVELSQAAGLRDMEVHARYWLSGALQMHGQVDKALVELTWILGAVETYRAELADADIVDPMARTYMNWVECARFLPQMPVAQLFAVLDAGEAWLRAAGRPNWRAGLLSQRARLLEAQGDLEGALVPAREAVALERRAPGAPGYTLATYRKSLGDLLRRLSRNEDAAAEYRAVLDDGRSSDYARQLAHQGLARCAVAAGDGATALREARRAVQLAEGMGDGALSPALSTLIAAARAAGDVPAAQAAAARKLEVNRRMGSDYALYFALRDALDVALDAGDVAAAAGYLAEAEPLAMAFDRQTGTQQRTGELDERRARLAALRDDPH